MTLYEKATEGPYHPFRDHNTLFGWGVRHTETGRTFALVGSKGSAFALAALMNGHLDAAAAFVDKDISAEYFDRLPAM